MFASQIALRLRGTNDGEAASGGGKASSVAYVFLVFHVCANQIAPTCSLNSAVASVVVHEHSGEEFLDERNSSELRICSEWKRRVGSSSVRVVRYP